MYVMADGTIFEYSGENLGDSDTSLGKWNAGNPIGSIEQEVKDKIESKYEDEYEDINIIFQPWEDGADGLGAGYTDYKTLQQAISILKEWSRSNK